MLLVQISRQMLLEHLSHYREYSKTQHKKLGRSDTQKSWLHQAASRLFFHSAAIEDNNAPTWYNEISRIAAVGEPAGFLEGSDIFKLFIILKKLALTDGIEERKIFLDVLSHFDFLPTRSLWDFICALDDAWVFRWRRESAVDDCSSDYIHVNPSPSNTPPPEEDTIGEERFVRLLSLDINSLESVTKIGNFLLHSGFNNQSPSDKLSILIDKLIQHDEIGLRNLSMYLEKKACTVAYGDDGFWQKCLDAEDLTLFFSSLIEPSEQNSKLSECHLSDPMLDSKEEAPSVPTIRETQQNFFLPFGLIFPATMTSIKRSPTASYPNLPISAFSMLLFTNGLPPHHPYLHNSALKSFPYQNKMPLSPRDSLPSDDAFPKNTMFSPSL